jgi:hypothetical protein
MSHCETCRWWEKYDHNEFGECQHPKLHDNIWGELGDDEAQAYDHGSIATGPRFGCVHWEGKE